MRILLPALALLIAAPAAAGDGDLLTVAGMQNHQRVLLVFAPALDDRRLEAQRAAMARFAAGAATRDLLFVQVSPREVLGARDNAARLRLKYRVGRADYRTFLIGKDGNVALQRAEPIDETVLQATIDAMPMRQAEVARAKSGLGKTVVDAPR